MKETAVPVELSAAREWGIPRLAADTLALARQSRRRGVVRCWANGTRDCDGPMPRTRARCRGRSPALEALGCLLHPRAGQRCPAGAAGEPEELRRRGGGRPSASQRLGCATPRGPIARSLLHCRPPTIQQRAPLRRVRARGRPGAKRARPAVRQARITRRRRRPRPPPRPRGPSQTARGPSW
jgi:hypothetical protein